MANHYFGQIQRTNDFQQVEYRKCEDCGTVMFIKGESPFFNMNCPKNRDTLKREKLRKLLEESN